MNFSFHKALRTEWTTLIHQKTGKHLNLGWIKESKSHFVIPLLSNLKQIFASFLCFHSLCFLFLFHHPIKFSWVIEQNIPYIIGFHLFWFLLYIYLTYTLVLPIHMGREKHKTFKRITKVKISFPCFRTLLSLHIAGFCCCLNESLNQKQYTVRSVYTTAIYFDPKLSLYREYNVSEYKVWRNLLYGFIGIVLNWVKLSQL